jgi:hypothetical protein
MKIKQKVFEAIVIIASITVIVSSVLYLAKGVMIPALGPFSLAVVMLGLVYSAKKQLDEGKVTVKYWRFMLCIGLIAGTANIIAGIGQLLLRK